MFWTRFAQRCPAGDHVGSLLIAAAFALPLLNPVAAGAQSALDATPLDAAALDLGAVDAASLDANQLDHNPIVAQRMGPRTVRLDGALRDWQASDETDPELYTVEGSEDAGFSFSLRYNRRGLHIAASIADDRIVRRQHHWQRQDALILRFGTPNITESGVIPSSETPPTPDVREVWLFPGRDDSHSASLALRASPSATDPTEEDLVPITEAGAQVVEGPRDGVWGPFPEAEGVVMEALIPYSLFADSKRWFSSRLTVRYRDVDSEAHPEPQETASYGSHQSFQSMPRIEPRASVGELLGRFLEKNELLDEPVRFETWLASEDGRRLKWVQLRGKTLMVVDPRLGRQAIRSLNLPVAAEDDIVSWRFYDITGDHQRAFGVTLRQTSTPFERTLWSLYRLDRRIRAILTVPTRVASSHALLQQHISLRRITPGRGEANRAIVFPVELSVTRTSHRGFTAASQVGYEAAFRDGEETIVPSFARTEPRTAHYRFLGGQFHHVPVEYR